MGLSDEQLKAAEAGISGRTQVVVILGFAGTGKSVVSRYIIERVPNILVCSNDGIAAQNIGGVTAASLFGIPTSFPVNPKFKDPRGQRNKDDAAKHWNRRNTKLPKSNPMHWEPIKSQPIAAATHLLIDEAFKQTGWSVDFIDKECRKSRRQPDVPFGGLKVIFVGDDGQGQPIVSNKDAEQLDKWGYPKPYDFRGAKVLEGLDIEYHTLGRIFRQSNGYDAMVLSRFRTGTETQADLEYINRRVVDKPPFGATVIAPYRRRVDMHNELGLSRISAPEITLKATIKGNFKFWTEKRLPFPSVLKLKPGCRVIIKQNLKTKIGQYTQQVFNGDQGVYQGMDKYKRLVVLLDNGEEVYLKKEKRFNGKKVNTEEICMNPKAPEDEQVWEKKERIVDDHANMFEQYPIRLGFAITIAASQGSTMKRVHLDLTDPIFGVGDLYTALSRVEGGFENLTLSRPLTFKDNIVAKDVSRTEGEQYEMFT